MTNPELFRTRSSYFYAGTVYIAAGMVYLLNLLENGVLNSVTTLSWALVASYTAYLIFIRPKVFFFDEGLQITNPFNQIMVGWHDVEDIDNRFSLSILVAGERHHAWAAPAPGRYAARGVHPTELKGLQFENQQSIRAADSPRSLSGAAALLARRRYDHFFTQQHQPRIEKQLTFNTAGVISFLAMLTFALAWTVIQR
jgi:hypothetical protein